MWIELRMSNRTRTLSSQQIEIKSNHPCNEEMFEVRT